jgi:hypothetical protein
MTTLDLRDEEREALIRFLRDGIDRDRFPLSPRLAPIRAILDKLRPPAPKPPQPERKTIVLAAGRGRDAANRCGR